MAFRLPAHRLERRIHAEGRTELLKACGLRHGMAAGLRVLDPFAGFAVDALALAAAGCEVEVYERHPLVWLFAAELIARLDLPLRGGPGDGLIALEQTEAHWDIIYLDPMFPARSKHALPNKAAQVLRLLTADAPHPDERRVLALARERADRVVLKRRPKDPLLQRPTFQVRARTVRFDVYC